MTDLSTIATAIEIGLERGMTGEQAINLLRQIRDQIRAEQEEAANRAALRAMENDPDFKPWRHQEDGF